MHVIEKNNKVGGLLRKAVLSSVSVLALGAMAAPTFAQNAAPAAANDSTVIVVTGIKGSLRSSLVTKKQSGQFVDAITSEEVGKLPDANIAEALQRVTGVQVTRNKGEGDFVTVRGLGPNFVRGTVNDRTVVNSAEDYDATRSGGQNYSTGRETNYDILPSTLISQVLVYKTPLASQVEGGMGAVVDVKTQRPLSLGNHVFVSASEMHRELNDVNDPSANALVSWRNDAKTFGILFGVDYNQRTIRQEDPDSFGWWAYGLNIDKTAHGSATDTNVSLPFSFNAVSRNEKRKRLAEQLTAEWVLSDDSRLVLDVLHSHRDVNMNEFGSVPLLSPNLLSTGGSFGNGVTNPDGSLQVPGGVVTGDSSLVSYNITNTAYNFTDLQKQSDDIWIAGLNYKKDIGQWSLAADLSYADSTGKINFDRASMDSPLIPFQVNVANDQIHVAIKSGGPNLGNASLYTLNNGDSIVRENLGKETDLALDATRHTTDSNFISAIRFGVRIGNRTADRVDNTSYGVGAVKINAGPLASSMLHYTGNFGGNAYALNSMLFPDIASVRAYLLANYPYGADSLGHPLTSGTKISFTPQYTPGSSYSNTETTLATYVQADIDTTIGDIPVKGNVGVRAIETQSSNTGHNQPFQIISGGGGAASVVYTSPNASSFTVKNSYLNVLPSLNLNAEVAHNLFLRFGMGTTMTRPTFSELSPGVTNINPSIRLVVTGNPKLVPYESKNVDLGLEWYVTKDTALYGTVFTKNIDNFIGTDVTLNTTYQGVAVNSLQQRYNEGHAQISGLEMGYQQTFDMGIGYIVNATMMDSNAEYTKGANVGKSIQFQGVSKRSMNATLFYEKNGISARVAYSYRSPFMVLDSDAFGHQLWNASYNQVDASVSYDVTKNWTVFLNGINLTNEPNVIYSDVPTRSVSYSLVGSRIQAGVRAKF